MDVKMSTYALARWLKEERCVNPSFTGSKLDMISNHDSRSRAEIIFHLLRCGKYNFIPTWFRTDWKIDVSEEDWKNANEWHDVIYDCVRSTISGRTYFNIPATSNLIKIINSKFKKYRNDDDGTYSIPFDDESQIFCSPGTNGYFNPDMYLHPEINEMKTPDVKETVKTMWNATKNLVGNNDEEDKGKEGDKTETITELEKYKTALKALAMAYSKYSQRNADQIMRLILKKAEENYEEVNKSYEFWVKLNKDIKSIKKVNFIN